MNGEQLAIFGQSQFGLNGVNIVINNINLNSGNRKRTVITGKSDVDSVYAVTGVTTGEENGLEKQVTASTITNIKISTGNTSIDGVYAWNQLIGQKASSTGTIYGIYDLSGGSWERLAGYVANGHAHLKIFGASIAYNGNTLKTVSSKYTTVYNHDSSKDNTSVDDNGVNIDAASQANYTKNILIYGNAMNETSMVGTGSMSWYGNYSYFPRIVPSIFYLWW